MVERTFGRLDKRQTLHYSAETAAVGRPRAKQPREDGQLATKEGSAGSAIGARPEGGGTGAVTGLFTRQASGLVRELGLPAAVGISMGAVAVVIAFINFNAGLTGFAKADMTLPLILAGVFWIVAMFSYRYLLQAIPRVGGEYVYLSRIVSPAAGAMVGISIAVLFAYALSSLANFVAQFAPFALIALGDAFKSSAISNAAGEIGGKTAIALISIGFLVLVGLCSFLSLRTNARIMLSVSVLQIVVFLVLGLLLLDHSHSDFVRSFGQYSGHAGAYQAVINSARDSGVKLGTSLTAMLAAVPFMVLTFNGVLYSYYVGGELRRPGRTYIRASSISIVVLVSVCVAIWLLMRHTVGLHFMQAQANLAPEKYEGISSLPSVAGGLGYGLVLSGDPVTKILFGLAMACASFGVCLAFIAIITRVLFALAFDRLLPESVAKINERSHTPTTAIAVTVVTAIGFAILSSFVNITSIVANVSLFFALIVLSGGIATTVLPFTRPELILKPGANDVERLLGIPKVSMLGALTSVLATAVVVDIVVNPKIFGGLSAASIVCLALVLLSGPVVYSIARVVRRRQSSLDISLAMRQLPPE